MDSATRVRRTPRRIFATVAIAAMTFRGLALAAEHALQPVDQPHPREVVRVGLDLDQDLSEGGGVASVGRGLRALIVLPQPN
jgi:hypothetical protein